MNAHKENLRNVDWMLKQISGASYEPVIFDCTEDPVLKSAQTPKTDINGLWRLLEKLRDYNSSKQSSDELDRYSQILTTRSLLDRYFEIPRGTAANRDWVTERMYAVMRERHIMSYRTEKQHGHISDAEIIAHWIFTLINLGTNTTAVKSHDIYDSIVVPYGEQPRSMSGISFWQVQSDPYYKIIVDKQVISPP